MADYSNLSNNYKSITYCSIFWCAWDLYGIARHFPANRAQLYKVANRHLTEALPNVASGEYMGDHWLASFAVYALTMQ